MFQKYIITCGLFALMIHGINANSVSSNTIECPQICPALFSPVCGTNGSIFKEFSNDCELAASNCRLARSALSSFSSTDMAWCTSELVENLQTVVGNLDLQKPECIKPCPMIYAPVCVSNGKYRTAVSNKCELEMFNCALRSLNPDSLNLFKVIREGNC